MAARGRMRPSMVLGGFMIQGFPAAYVSQHSRIRSNRKVLSASLKWQCAITQATPLTSSTTRGVMIRGCSRCHPCSYTIVMAHCLAIAVVNRSKPGGRFDGEDRGISEREWL